MDWGTFFTAVGQGLIVFALAMLGGMVFFAIIKAIREGDK
jgi:hypothetical protein